jgi:hypothetical protein
LRGNFCFSIKSTKISATRTDFLEIINLGLQVQQINWIPSIPLKPFIDYPGVAFHAVLEGFALSLSESQPVRVPDTNANTLFCGY